MLLIIQYNIQSYAARTLLLALCIMLGVNANAQKKDTTITTPNKRINPFFQVGKDSAEIERMNQSKQEQQKRDNPKAPQKVDTVKQATINSPTNYHIMGEDKYLKVRQDDRKYDTFQVYEVKDLDKKHTVVGMLTNTLERGTRYDDKGAIPHKVEVSTGMVDRLDDQGKVIPGGKLNISSIKFNDKIFVIIGENDYRYLDGKKLVGNQQMVKELLKGKPITELTFYYELVNAGVVDPKMTYKQFSGLKLEEKFNILGPYAKE